VIRLWPPNPFPTGFEASPFALPNFGAGPRSWWDAAETFVDTERFRGTCYRAANWVYLGLTTGEARMIKRAEPIGH